MRMTRLSHLTLYVMDQDKAHDVYVNKLGFHLKTDLRLEDGFRWMTVSPADNESLEIHLCKPRPPMFTEEHAASLMSVLEAHAMGGGVFQVEDCEKAYRSLKKKGFEFTKPPTQMFYGIEAMMRDGCGNWFSVTQFTEQEP